VTWEKSKMKRWTACLVTLLALVLAWNPAARASCAPHTAAQYFKQAELVFLGRAGKISIKGKLSRQPITVLLALKGKPGRVFTRVRVAGVQIPNDRVYKRGEVALFFATKGEVDLCSGNFPLGAQMREMGTYLKLGRRRTGRPPLAAFRLVVDRLLRPYLHKRPTVPVAYPPLAGQRLRQGATTLPFVRGARKGAVRVDQAVSAGGVHVISGFYPTEGFAFQALLREAGGKLEVLHASGWER
jgi:hypothetical protein